MIPYHDVIDTADRRWTSFLLERFDADYLLEDELDNLIRALHAVSDPRSFSKLEAVVTDATRPTKIRETAGMAIRGLAVPAETLRRWWQEGDCVLRRHALHSMNALVCPDIVLQVAANATHVLQADALQIMDSTFNLPEHQAIKIAALSNSDAAVRAAAACMLICGEPVAAEGSLIEATYDHEPEVVAAAVYTLDCYHTLPVIQRLHQLTKHYDDNVRQEAQESYEWVRENLQIHLQDHDRVAEHIRRWLEPVWKILAFTDEELTPPDFNGEFPGPPDPPDRDDAIPVADLLDMLGDPDTSPKVLRDRLQWNDWQRYRTAERRRLRSVLLTHPDPLVRNQAADAFSAWQEGILLRDLALDQNAGVRHAAIMQMQHLPAMPRIADFIWECLHLHRGLGISDSLILDVLTHHADPAAAVRYLSAIAADCNSREAVRLAAVIRLGSLRAANEVSQLSSILLEPARCVAHHNG